MEQKQENFSDMLAFGEEGEHEVAKYLISKGVNVLPLYQFMNDHAPYILSTERKVVSPDLICFRKDCFMVEVKTKNQWVKFNGTVETGIDRRLYNHYKTIQELTRKEVYVIFNHKTQEPLGYFMAELNNYTRIWDGVVKAQQVHPAMIFYNFNILKKL